MKVKLIYILLIVMTVVSCKKGGTGGSATVVTMVTHHGAAINGARVFVKYGSYGFAGTDTSVYDSKQLTNSDGYTKFKELKVGYYSFYAIGYDSVSKVAISGNHYLKVKMKDKGNEVELGVGVSEE